MAGDRYQGSWSRDRGRGGSPEEQEDRDGGFGGLGPGEREHPMFGGARGFGGRRNETFASEGYGYEQPDTRSPAVRRDPFPTHHEFYRNWRDEQVARFDRDYEDYCRERSDRFETDFAAWREARRSGPAPAPPEGHGAGGSAPTGTEDKAEFAGGGAGMTGKAGVSAMHQAARRSDEDERD